MKGILGRKSGMTTVFSNEGKAIPVTVVDITPNSVLQVKNVEKDGYDSVKLGFKDKKENKSNKAEMGIAKAAKTLPKYFIREIRNMTGLNIGDKIDGSIFTEGSLVDVTGISKGKGFQGAIKRHNQARGPMSHGSKFHRAPGSLGDIRGTVKRTKKMPGHMGHEQVTMQNLQIISINTKDNYMLIKGSIPGPNKSFVIVKDAIKGQNPKLDKVNLINVKNEAIKNELLENGKKVNANLNTNMSIDEMKSIIKEATVKYEAEKKEYNELLEKAKKLKINKYNKMKLPELRKEVEKVQKLVEQRKKKDEEAKK